MDNRKDILEEIGRTPYKVPEGYFQNLKDRLDQIPSEAGNVVQPSFWQRTRPYVALAASFAAALVIGTFILRNTTGSEVQEASSLYEELYYSDLIPITQPETVFMDSEYEETLSEDDVISYLLASGASAERIQYTAYLGE